MRYHLAVCNPAKVFNVGAFFRSGRTEGQWRTQHGAKGQVSVGDTIFLQITGAGDDPGIKAKFIATAVAIGQMKRDFWIDPEENDVEFVTFRIERVLPNSISPSALRSAGFSGKPIEIPEQLSMKPLHPPQGKDLEEFF